MGGPNVTFQWETRGRIVGYDKVLKLANLNASYGGNYTCTVNNAAGSDSVDTTLFIEPYVVTPLDEIIITVSGSNKNISCDTAGFPSPDMKWVDSTNKEISDSPLLEFSPATFGDEGLYRCVITAEINGMNFTVIGETLLVGMCHNINRLLTSYHAYLFE